MTIKILNFKHPCYNQSGIDAIKTWISPDKRYAVAGIFRGGYYVAGKVIEYDDSHDTLIIDFVDCLSRSDDVYIFGGINVDWSYMKYGFCKLICWNIETNQYRNSRFYFDPELYKQKYEEINGIPYSGQKTFSHQYTLL